MSCERFKLANILRSVSAKHPIRLCRLIGPAAHVLHLIPRKQAAVAVELGGDGFVTVPQGDKAAVGAGVGGGSVVGGCPASALVGREEGGLDAEEAVEVAEDGDFGGRVAAGAGEGDELAGANGLVEAGDVLTSECALEKGVKGTEAFAAADEGNVHSK